MLGSVYITSCFFGRVGTLLTRYETFYFILTDLPWLKLTDISIVTVIMILNFVGIVKLTLSIVLCPSLVHT